MIRVRHYTRISAMRKILADQRLVAWDQNKVFVERTTRRKLSPVDAEERYGLDRGQGNACIEFDIEPELLQSRYNSVKQGDESFIEGDVDLGNRNPVASVNF